MLAPARCGPGACASSRMHRGRPRTTKPGKGERAPRRTSVAPRAGEPSGPGGGGKEALLARIAAAKKYKEGSSAGGVHDGSAAPEHPGGLVDLPPGRLPPRAPIDYAAMTDFLENPKGASTSGGLPPQPPAPLAPGQGYMPSPPDSPLRVTRMGPADGSSVGQQTSSGAGGPGASDGPPGSDPRPFLQRSPQSMSSEETARMVLAAKSATAGSADQASGAIAAVMARETPAMPKGMRMEEYNAQLELEQRRRGAEIITKDAGYSPGAGMKLDPFADAAKKASVAAARSAAGPASAEAGSGKSKELEMYTPKVATWGTHPRPKNISEAYGGGRNIRPGQALETEEQATARQATYDAAMKSYRQKMGLDIDPAVEEAAQAVYDEGIKLFNNEDLRGAYEKFNEASKMIPLRTKVGGYAVLQKAITLDSLGYSEDAKKLYRSLRGHAIQYVAKTASQMSFGFKAAEFLKADQFSYGTKKSDYMKYFRGFADRNKVYVSSEEERLRDEQMNRISALIAVTVLVAPIALLGSLAAQRGVFVQ